MKVARLSRIRPVGDVTSIFGGGTAGGPGGQVPTSNGSNVAWSSNVAIITSNSSNALTGPFVNFQSGTGVSFAASSNTLTISASANSGVSLANITWPTAGGAFVAGGPSVTLVTGARKIMATISSSVYVNVGSELYLTLYEDGSNVGDATYGYQVLTGTGAWLPVAINYVSNTLSPGSHTWAIYVKTAGGNSATGLLVPRFSVFEIGP